MRPSTSARTTRPRMAVIAGALAMGLAVVGASPAFAAPSAASVTLTLSPTTVDIGDTVTATATLVATADVFAYDVTFSFDDELFEYVADSATGPDGGFDAVTEGVGEVTLTHTRLGTSPSLSGDIVLTAAFEAIGDGDTTIDVPTITLVDELGAVTPLEDAASAEVLVEADEVTSPSPSPSPSTTTSPADDGSLATTGSDMIGMTVLLAIAATSALGIGFVLVRRRIASTR